MSKDYGLGLHIFRRDLRLEDNTSLLYLLEHCDAVLCCFIFDDRQVHNNPYKGAPAFQFLISSLEELDGELKKKGSQLYVFSGVAEEVVGSLLQNLPIDVVSVNKDYTPFAKKRDLALQQVCDKKKVSFFSHADSLLHEPEEIHKDNGEPYTVFTPFFKKARTFPVALPQKNTRGNYYSKSISSNKSMRFCAELLPKKNQNLLLSGGRKEGLLLLEKASQLDSYAIDRDIPSLDMTSHLSAHNKFGTLSIREVYHFFTTTFSFEHTLISELFWRDFFTHITYHFPHVFQGAFRKKYDAIEWSTNENMFQAWCLGKTGVPLVDAGMRELNETGYMHNRVRMVVASFLVKNLHISWRKGELYFAQHLLDYDPGVNNGNWQWAASTGCDAQPYFRIFNPWRQQERFDPDCLYIKKWVPELSSLTPKEIHKLESWRPLTPISYPKPIVSHKESSAQAKAMFAALK